MADGSIVIDTKIDESGITKGMQDIQKSIDDGMTGMNKMGSNTKKWGQGVVSVFAPIAAASSLAFGTAIKGSMDFEKNARKAATLTGGSYDQIKNSIFEMAQTSVYSTGEVANSMADLGAMGFDAGQAIDAMPGILNAAAASGEDLALVSQTVASALNGFGLEASESGRVADILAQGANQSAASVHDMSYALKYAAPSANALGISMEELAAATGIMTDSGMKGSQAGTTLRQALARLVDPPAKAKDALEELGVETLDAEGNFKSLSTLLPEMAAGMEDMTEAQKLATLSQIFGTEAASGMLTLLNSSDGTFQQMTENLENSAGASEKAADSMLEGWAGALTVLASTWDVAQRALVDALAPAIETVAGWLTTLLNAFTNLSPETRKWIGILAGLVAVISVVMTVIGTLAIAIGGVMATGVGAWFAGVAAVLFKMLIPVALVGAAIVGLGVFIYNLYKRNETFRKQVQSIWNAIKNAISTAIQTAVKIIRTVWGAITTWWVENQDQVYEKAFQIWNMIYQAVSTAITTISAFIMSIWGQLTTWWTENQETILAAAQNVWAVIQTIISVAMPIIQTIIQTAWTVIQFIIESVWNNIKGVIQGGLTFIQGIITFFSGLFTGNFSAMWEGIKMIFSGAVQFLWNLVQLLLWGKLIKGALSFIGLFRSHISSLWAVVKSLFSSGINFIRSIFTGGFNAMRSTGQTVMNAIRSVISSVWNAIRSIISSVINAIRSVVSGGFNSVRSVVTNVTNAIRSVISSVWNAIRSVISSVINAIKSVVSGGFNAVKSTVSSVTSAIKSTISNIFGSFGSIVTGAMSKVKNAVSSGMSGALGAVRGMMGSFLSAGSNIVGSIADGIRGAMGKVTGAMKNLASKIRSFLPFSPAKEGALRDIMKTNIAGSIADTIDKGAKHPIKSMSKLASNINDEMSGISAVTEGISGSFSFDSGGVNTDQINKEFRKYQESAERHITGRGSFNLENRQDLQQQTNIYIDNHVDERGITSMVNHRNSKDKIIKRMARK